MKKNSRTILAVLLFVMLITENVFPSKQNQTQTPSSASKFTDYTWFLDQDMTDPTGTSSPTNVEIMRLQLLYPGYTFSSSFSMGLFPYEYGDHTFFPTVVIYSNR